MRVLTVVLGAMLCLVLGGAAPTLAATGSIAGTVTEAGGGDGIDGVQVCASSHVFGPIGGCTGTEADGSYELDDLEPGFYEVAFEEEGRQNYLAQRYPGKAAREEAVWVEVKSGEDRTGIDAVLTVGAQITGTVTDVEGGAPIEGIQVCAPEIDRFAEGGVIHCDETDASGEYKVWALPTGQFKVEFGPAIFQRGAPNYIRQFYPGKPSWSEAEVRGVTAGTTYSGVDAALRKGVGVEGTVTEVGGAPVSSGNTRVCAHDASSEEIAQCTGLGMDGSYWLPGLPFGSYRISFAVDVEEEPGLILHPDGFVRQYYNAKPTFAEADVLSSSIPTVFTGIDAQLLRGPETFPNRRPPAPQPIVVTLIERSQAPPLRCKKGFRKKFVKGKRRCVKVHKKHRRHGQGPRAHATGH